MNKIIVFVLEDQFVRFFLAAAAALVYYPFSFGRKVHVGEPAAAEFLLSKRVFFVFWSTHREKKRCVCCCKACLFSSERKRRRTKTNIRFLLGERKENM